MLFAVLAGFSDYGNSIYNVKLCFKKLTLYHILLVDWYIYIYIYIYMYVYIYIYIYIYIYMFKCFTSEIK